MVVHKKVLIALFVVMAVAIGLVLYVRLQLPEDTEGGIEQPVMTGVEEGPGEIERGEGAGLKMDEVK